VTNSFFTFPENITRNTLGRAETLAALFNSVEDGFDLLPDETKLRYLSHMLLTDTSGAANQITATFTVVPSAYTDLPVLFVIAANAPTGATTIDVNSLGSIQVRRFDDAVIEVDDWAAGSLLILVRDTSTGRYRLAGQHGADVIATAADAVSTAADAVQTALDVIATNADAVSTAADVVSTGNDATATAADLVLTNADVVLTNADVVSTGNDALATAADVLLTNADVVLTHADVVLTAADAAQTALDVIDTAADVVSTGSDATQTALDVIATAADAVQTALDVIAAAASASAAAISEANAAATLSASVLKANNLSDVTAATAFSNIKQDATATATGVIELATQTEVNTGTDATRAVTPQTLASWSGKGLNHNLIINGSMQIAQRGTSFTDANGYTLDRWYATRSGAVGGLTVSKVTSGTPTGSRYAMRLQRVNGNTATNQSTAYYAAESKDSYVAAGQKLTLSFKARCGANYSSASNGLYSYITAGTGTDASPLVLPNVKTTTQTLSTSWQTFTVTTDTTLATNITQIGLLFAYIPTGTAGVDDWFEITDVKLEIGEVATDYTYPSFVQDLLLCQRYFSKCFSPDYAPQVDADVAECFRGAVAAWSATLGWANTLKFPVNMRAIPSLTFYNGVGLGTASNKVAIFTGSWHSPTDCYSTGVTRESFSIELVDTFTSGDSYLCLGGWAADAEL